MKTDTNPAPSFAERSIAFHRSPSGRVRAYRIYKLHGEADGSRSYDVSRNGLMFRLKASELLTGWEADFPTWTEIDWGDVGKGEEIAAECPPDEEIQEFSGFEDEWEPDDAYYSDLAAEWEAREAASTEQLELFPTLDRVGV